MVTTLTKFDELLKVVGREGKPGGCKRLIIVEGARGVGKDHLIERILEGLKPWVEGQGYMLPVVYEPLKPRKKTMDGTGRTQPPLDFDIQEGHFWALDFLRQCPPQMRVIFNRSMLSSQFWDGPREDRLELWYKLVHALDGLIIMVNPTPREHQRRLTEVHRGHEWNSVINERAHITAAAHELPQESVMWFQES